MKMSRADRNPWLAKMPSARLNTSLYKCYFVYENIMMSRADRNPWLAKML